MKKCIFYLPYKLDENGAGARMIRPRKMIEAFKSIGYEVASITGTSSERRPLIKEIKRRIKRGEQFDFMYTESSTEPTLLTDPSHLPTHPFLDFGFFKFIKNSGIPIGLFYCDIYWKFDSYGKELAAWKRNAAILNYKYDIAQYKRLLSKLYVADLRVCSYIGEEALARRAVELPPGADNLQIEQKNLAASRDFTKEPLSIFYVGGLGGHYRILELVKAVAQIRKTKLVICCREKEWEKERDSIIPFLCERIRVIHKTSGELEPFYGEADVCSLLFRNDVYIQMAKPFKAYEYLAHEIPVLATKGTSIGNFVEENDIGWSIPFDAGAIASTIESIVNDPKEWERKSRNCEIAKHKNLWTNRAQTVVSSLINSIQEL